MPMQVCMEPMMACHIRGWRPVPWWYCHQQGFHEYGARRQHHGSHSHGEHHAVWDVHVAVEPVVAAAPPRLWVCSLHALHSGNARAVGSRRGHGPARQLPALDNVSQLMCIWGGVITFTSPGEHDGRSAVGSRESEDRSQKTECHLGSRYCLFERRLTPRPEAFSRCATPSQLRHGWRLRCRWQVRHGRRLRHGRWLRSLRSNHFVARWNLKGRRVWFAGDARCRPG